MRSHSDIKTLLSWDLTLHFFVLFFGRWPFAGNIKKKSLLQSCEQHHINYEGPSIAVHSQTCYKLLGFHSKAKFVRQKIHILCCCLESVSFFYE